MTSLTARPGARAQARGRASGANNIEKQIMGVPARIMRPCLLLVAAAVGLTLFGLVMIYSASSVEAMSEQGDAAFYVKRQALFIVAGLVLAAGAAKADYHKLCSKTGLAAMGLVIIGMLVVVRVAGSGANGATRWLEVGPLRLQPSEFAKVFVLLAASGTAAEFFAERTIDQTTFLKRLGLYVGLPVLLIVVQPDKGTAGIICLLVFVIAYDAGFDRDVLIKFALLVAVVGLVYSLRDDYSRQRVLTMFNPWSDEWGNGYQLTRGFMAFGSGGLTGVGLGMSRMKYSYLPEAHNDYILAIIGEEVGFVGTVLFFLVFAMLIYSAFRIAEQATDRRGALMASGSAVILAVQFLINALGILNVFPMTGKPLPFISYGGSSIIVSLMLAGLILRVSYESARRDEYDRRRESFAVMDESTAGVAHVRGERPSRSGFTVLDGSASEPAARPRSRTAPQGRPQRPSPRNAGGGYNRIDLNSDPSARLRTDDQGPRVRRDYHDR